MRLVSKTETGQKRCARGFDSDFFFFDPYERMAHLDASLTLFDADNTAKTIEVQALE